MTQKPDEATAKDSGGGFDPHSEGQYAVMCVDVVNLGIRIDEYPGKDPRESPKVALVFASGEHQDGGDMTIVTVEMTLSMYETANMRQFLESWRGKSYTPEQAEAGVPLHKLHKQAGLASIEHIITKRGRKFAKLRSISPLPDGMQPPDPKILEEYERPEFFTERKKEYATQLAEYRSRHVTESYDDGIPETLDDDDVLPF